MASKSPSERIEELTQRIQILEIAFEKHRAVTDLKVQRLELRDTDYIKTQEELRNKLTEEAQRNERQDEKCRHLEKLSDRTWQVWLALIIAFLGLIVAYLKK